MEYSSNVEKKIPKEFEVTGFITELVGLSSYLEQQDSLEASLRELTGMVSHLLRVSNCSIMLLNGEEDKASPRLRVLAHHGCLPEEAYDEPVDMDRSISGKVVGSGEALVVSEIFDSPFAVAARRPSESGDGGFISCPLLIKDKVVGVLNVSTPMDGRTLGHDDLEAVTIVALLVSKSIQVLQLNSLLQSNFIQLALSREIQMNPSHTVMQIANNGDKMAKVLAKSFFIEMRNAGFSSDHIVKSATEIISLLSSDISESGSSASK
ncbi:GAF domain-containing protein [Motiliproteus coralliicola]|uniref:GAF domain-containing protein n=1 Tax=Motiliproteus coralliicola TaxID=2283196 RepID=A0A369WSY6_9GAMM|nr:GAF domain-containing protein [Motiliproteus coralliicola]RDE24787.1 GAF domain-containing protein [Motiliproteus coralliicola]